MLWRDSRTWQCFVAAIIALLTIASCGSPQQDETSASEHPRASATQSAPTSADPASADPTPTEADPESPEAAFRAWLKASRAPDPDAACGYLSDALVDKMLAEFQAIGMQVADCAAMTTATAELYAALGQAAEVEVETLSHTAQRAELFVTYAGGDCGRVEMRPRADTWIMTENSEEEC